MDIKIDNGSVEQIVKAQIALAVSEALSKNTPYLVDRLVKEALSKKKEDRYGGRNERTIIEAITHDLIKKAATEAANEWLETIRPRVKELVITKLSDKTEGLIASIADQLVVSLEKGFTVRAYFDNE